MFGRGNKERAEVCESRTPDAVDSALVEGAGEDGIAGSNSSGSLSAERQVAAADKVDFATVSRATVTVVGAGLAGCEAAWQLARRGVRVTLIEMKPAKRTPAHISSNFGELVCSNSLRGRGLENAPGLLKEELRRLGSLIMLCADATETPAGGALAVDRERFSALITERICSHPLITVVTREVCEIPDGYCIIATGPLTTDPLAAAIFCYFGEGHALSFYDAAAPIVTFDSIDMTRAFFGSRYEKGGDDYINCPLTREEYEAFVTRLSAAQEAPVHGFEDARVFEGCMPVEVMARRGFDTLRFGPLKPVGITDPETGRWPYAACQLRRDNIEGTLYNLVGFQTHLTFGEQKAVFSMIPALKSAEFVRYGVMHRNTYINSPKLLDRFYRVRGDCRLAFAGQITGVEGYIESTASGLYAAINMANEICGLPPFVLENDTAIGALASYVCGDTFASGDFQPMNINFGIMKKWDGREKKRERYRKISERALAVITDMLPL